MFQQILGARERALQPTNQSTNQTRLHAYVEPFYSTDRTIQHTAPRTVHGKDIKSLLISSLLTPGPYPVVKGGSASNVVGLGVLISFFSFNPTTKLLSRLDSDACHVCRSKCCCQTDKFRFVEKNTICAKSELLSKG